MYSCSSTSTDNFFPNTNCGERFSWFPIKVLPLAQSSPFGVILPKNTWVCMHKDREKLACSGSSLSLYINALFCWNRNGATKSLKCSQKWREAVTVVSVLGHWMLTSSNPSAIYLGWFALLPSCQEGLCYFGTPCSAAFTGSLVLLNTVSFHQVMMFPG